MRNETKNLEELAQPVAYTEKHEISNMHATGLYLRAWPGDRNRNTIEGYTIPLYSQEYVNALLAEIAALRAIAELERERDEMRVQGFKVKGDKE